MCVCVSVCVYCVCVCQNVSQNVCVGGAQAGTQDQPPLETSNDRVSIRPVYLHIFPAKAIFFRMHSADGVVCGHLG